jgi:hypothetical protein
MAIDPLSDEKRFESLPVREAQNWEKAAEASTYLFGTIAVAALGPFSFRKPRHFSYPFLAPAPEAPVEESPPQPVPRCSEGEQGIILDIFSTTATASWLELANERSRLEGLGETISRIHPLSLLLAMPREHMRQIFQSWNIPAQLRIIKDVKKSMEREKERANLDLYLPSFSEAICKEEKPIRDFIRRSDYEGLIKYLFLPQ